MKYLNVVRLVLEVLAALAAFMRERERKQQQAEYDQTVRDIEADPVGYAQREYGRLRDGDREQRAESVSGSEADRP